MTAAHWKPTPSLRLFGYITAIAVGVMIACYGQLELNWLGVSRPKPKEKSSTATGVAALSICTKATVMYRYAALPKPVSYTHLTLPTILLV